MKRFRSVRECLLLVVALSATAVTAGCSVYDVGRNKPGSSPRDGTHMDGGSSLTDGAPRGDGSVVVGRPDSGDNGCQGEDPTCERAHALTACVRGTCVLVQCDAPYVDCDGEADNGCEAQLDSLDNCGLCGSKCSLPGAETRCESGHCQFVQCAPGNGDCDDDSANGCETPLDSIANCGECGHTCDSLPRANPGCVNGSCGVGECLGAYGDCDKDPSNGCEQPLLTNDHCGACDTPCAPDNGEGNCDTGQCAIVKCTGDAQDCDGLVANGCEATALDTADNCGACGAACDLPLHATVAACVPGAQPDAHACGVDHACAKGQKGCTDGAAANGCEDGWADCDGLGSNGCETQLGTLSDCGSCGDECDEANAVTACVSGHCMRSSCEPGFGDCNTGACTSLAADTQHCGACGTSCSAAPNCKGGKCTDQSCGNTTADCNGQAGDGCETQLTTTANCGQCGLSCGPYPHASATCQVGRCALGGCDPGWLDCDGKVWNGCEVDAHTAENCGACKQACWLPNATESCSTGSCKLVECDPGHDNCDNQLANGCEASTALPTSCGTCGNDCTGRANTQSGGCEEGACKLVCTEGYRDCNGDASDGCEAGLASAEHCGACDNDCTALGHVRSATCSDGACLDLQCDKGYGDCDGITSNGCERATNTATDCGGCNTPCSLPHTEASCSSGSCQPGACAQGYDDCNGDPSDGCEASLNDAATCGGCSNKCANGLQCINGKCGCSQSSQCGNANEECCDGLCVDTASFCSWIPCGSGNNRTITSCGACGNDCRPVFPFCCAN